MSVDTRIPEAHRLYLLGRFHWNKMNIEGWKRSIDCFNRALQLDNQYALAQAGLAVAYVSLGSEYLPPAEAMAKARQAATAALELDETLAPAHISLALVKAYYDWDWNGAGREFERAIELEPNSPDAHRERGLYLATLGRPDEAIRETRKALQLDPVSPVSNFAAGWALIGARRYRETIDHFEKVRDLHPQLAAAFNLTGIAQFGNKRYQDAATDLLRAASLNPDGLAVKAELSFAYGKEGARPKAEAILRELQDLSRNRYVSPYYFALIYAGMGNEDQALDRLEEAYHDRSRRLWALNVVPMWDGLRSNSKFESLLRRMGLAR
jgi:serine/threonine-protein kinase